MSPSFSPIRAHNKRQTLLIRKLLVLIELAKRPERAILPYGIVIALNHADLLKCLIDLSGTNWRY